ncbi:unnamed protein product [Schistosoma intercalatum]|nr:unnamed protein product [Schistosoma intercalatum]CAH8551405.1 unnamed protein product [Schistosoma intercalatum]
MRDCLVTQLGTFLNVWPIYFQRFFLISSSTGIWFVLSNSRLLLIRSIIIRYKIKKRHFILKLICSRILCFAIYLNRINFVTNGNLLLDTKSLFVTLCFFFIFSRNI